MSKVKVFKVSCGVKTQISETNISYEKITHFIKKMSDIKKDKLSKMQKRFDKIP